MQRHALGWCKIAASVLIVSLACSGFPSTTRGSAAFLQIGFVHSWETGPAYRDRPCQHEAVPGWVICLFPSVTVRRSRCSQSSACEEAARENQSLLNLDLGMCHACVSECCMCVLVFLCGG